MRPVGPAIRFPIEPTFADPTWPEFAGCRRAAWELGAGSFSVVQSRVHQVRVAGVVIEERHEDVARVASDDDVFGLLEEWDPVGGEMTFDEAAMTLRRECRVHGVERHSGSGLDPRRDL